MSAALSMTDELQPKPFKLDPEQHKGLVWREVLKWQWACTAGALELEDLVQAGNEGLANAARKFRPELGWKFTTYAVFWVRERVQREALDKCRTVRVTAREALRAHKAGTPYPVHSVRLDLPIGTEDGDSATPLVDYLLAQTVEHEGEADAVGEEMRNTVAACIDALPERLAHIIRCRFFRDMTLEEVGRDLAITRERARQLQVQALDMVKAQLVARKVTG